MIDSLPSCGKSTAINTLYHKFKSYNANVGAIVTSDIRDDGKRTECSAIVNSSDDAIELAQINIKNSNIYQRLGRYYVNIYNIVRKIVPNILDIVAKNDIVLIDEVTSMQILSVIIELLY